MHHEYTDYLFAHVDNWDGCDDYGFSFAIADLDDFIWDVSDNAPESLQNESQQHVSRVLADHFGARHVILHWSETGSRTVHPMRSLEHATAVYRDLLGEFEEWLTLSADNV